MNVTLELHSKSIVSLLQLPRSPHPRDLTMAVIILLQIWLGEFGCIDGIHGSRQQACCAMA